MKNLVLTAAVFALINGAPAVAQVAPASACKVQEDELAQLSEKYKPEQDRLAARGKELEDEAPANLKISGEIKFQDEHIALDLPQVTMKVQKVGFDVPQVTMKQRSISFNVVDTVMERQKIGEKPNITCRNRPHFPYTPRCTTTWDPIYADVPVLKTTTKSFSTDIPEVKMQRTDLSLDIPEVAMKRVDMYYKLPTITVKNPIPETGPIEKDGKELEAEAQGLAGRINADAAEATAALYRCHTDGLVAQRAEIVKDFDGASEQLTSAIATVTRMGANPASFTTESGTVNLVKQLDDLLAMRKAALEQIDAAIKQMRAEGEKDLKAAAATKA